MAEGLLTRYLDPTVRRGGLLPLGVTKDGKRTFALPEPLVGLLQGIELPGQAMRGEVPVTGPDGRTSEYVIDRMADAGGIVTLGAAAMPSAGGATLRAGAQVPKGIKAYHGSPHDFDKFSMDKIGTGEGAQAYGHGLYFAENEGTARFYRDELSGNTSAVTKSGIPLRESKKFGEWGSWVNSRFRSGATPEEIAEGLRRMVARDGQSRFAADRSRYRRAMALADEIAAGNVRWKSDGRLYEVNIKANPDDFLDWDSPLPDKLKPVAEKHLGEMARFADTGGRLVAKVGTRDIVPDLQAAGIPGIKYLDAGSRGAGDGSRNYVVFDENLIEIVRKYGIVGALSAGLLSQQEADALRSGEYQVRPNQNSRFMQAMRAGNAT